MKGLPPNGQDPLQNLSNKGMVEEMTSKTGIIAPGSDQHTKEPVKTCMEGLVAHENHPFIDPLGPLLIEQLSMTYFDDFYSYCLPEGLEISPPLSTTLVVDPARAQYSTVGASSLLGTFVT
jgi:hypothetical protein